MGVEEIDYSIYRGSGVSRTGEGSPEDLEADRSEICAIDYPGEGVQE